MIHELTMISIDPALPKKLANSKLGFIPEPNAQHIKTAKRHGPFASRVTCHEQKKRKQERTAQIGPQTAM